MKTLQEIIDENAKFLIESQKRRIDKGEEFKKNQLTKKLFEKRAMYKAGHGKKRVK